MKVKPILLAALCGLLARAGLSSAALAQSDVDRTILPSPQPPFEGKIGKTYKQSKSEWPVLPSPSEGAPNVLVILLDDVGFGQISIFGGLALYLKEGIPVFDTTTSMNIL